MNLPELPAVDYPAAPAPVGPDRPALEKTEKPADVSMPAAVKESVPAVPGNGGRVIDVMELGRNAREALGGIPADLVSGRGTLYEVFTKNQRLRGIGFVLVLIALFAAVLQLVR